MMKSTVFLLAAAFVLSGCGFKGDLYLPKEGDNARFGVIQTGIGLDNSAPVPQQPAPAKQP